MPVISVGVDHDHATMELLETVTVPDADAHKVFAQLAALDDLDEVVLVSTCLRTEVYAVIERFHGAVDGITAVLAERAGLGADELAASVAVHFDRGVPQHLFAVAAGLRSVVPGETEVLGQLRRALERAEEAATAGPELRNLFRHALAAGRRVRQETGIARGTTSFAHATVQLAEERLGTLEGTRVVLVGAGQLAGGLLDALLEARTGRPGHVVVANRTLAAAEGLRARAPDVVAAVGLDRLEDATSESDLLIAAVEADGHLVGPRTLRGGSPPRLVIDLGMPRAVDTAVGGLDGVELLDLDHLRDVVEATLRERRDELAAAEGIVDEEVARYLEARRARGAAPIITALRTHLEAIREAEVARAAGELATLDATQRERVDQLTRALVAKLAHEPTVVLRETGGTDRGERLAEALRQLFGL